MPEEKIFFQSKGFKLEGLINESTGETGVVVTHPHPLYGGEMHNNVVEALVNAYHQKGFTTLRFNFRGVGNSGGSHGQGVGEKEDVKAALAHLGALGKTSLDLAGYSFGSWVNAMGLESFDQVETMVMVSPPVGVIDFSFLGYNPRIQLVITGSEDDIAPPGMIENMITTWNPEAEFRVIQGADHFYWSGTTEVTSIVKTFLDRK